MQKDNLGIKSYLWLLGFTGCLYFIFHEPFFLIFFSFFGWKWDAKYMGVEPDEIFKANSYKAFSYAAVLAGGMLSVCMSVIDKSYIADWLSVERKYYILVRVIVLSCSILFIVYGYLLDKYEKSSRNIN